MVERNGVDVSVRRLPPVALPSSTDCRKRISPFKPV
jgi:hypothetical protein